jgi:hypothetical protein
MLVHAARFLVFHAGFELLVDAVVTASLVATLLHFPVGVLAAHTALALAHVAAAVYAAEACLKLALAGPRAGQLLRSPLFAFDAGTALVAALLAGLARGGVVGERFAYVVVFRALRVLRHLLRLSRFRAILRTVRRLYPVLRSLLILMFGLYYFFAIIGVDLFRGLIEQGSMPPDFADTYYAQNNYWENNFDDMSHAMVTLFEIMIINNWNSIVEGFTVAARSNAPRLFFVAFFFCSVIVLLNVVVTLVLEAFIRKDAAPDAALDGREHARTVDLAALAPAPGANLEAGALGALDEDLGVPAEGEGEGPQDMDAQNMRMLVRAMHEHARSRQRDPLVQRMVTLGALGDAASDAGADGAEAWVGEWRVVLKKRTQRLYRVVFDSKNADV